jgi:hypothetical protein
MGLVALFAVDFAMVPGITGIPNGLTRIGLFGALPMVHGLVIYLVVLGARLRRLGEIRLSSGVFLLVGGIAVFALGLVVSVAPQIFNFYVDCTAGIWVRPGQNVADIYRFGMGHIDPLLALLVCVTVTPLLVIPALLAARTAREYRLRLVKASDPPGS